mgnify:CR=1 FL=1
MQCQQDLAYGAAQGASPCANVSNREEVGELPGVVVVDVLRFGADAEMLAPKSLRASAMEALRLALGLLEALAYRLTVLGWAFLFG